MILKQLNRLQQLDQLIRQKRTGNAKELAEKLGISRRQVYNWIDELKALGMEIGYDRDLRCFVYQRPYKLSIHIRIENLSEARVKLNAEIFSMKNSIVQ